MKEFKRGKFNFVQPGTETLFDETIEDFKKEEFKAVLEKHPEVKHARYKWLG